MKRAEWLLIFFILVFLAGVVGNFARAQSEDTTPPTSPGNITATVIQASHQIQISWTASTDDVGVVGYFIYRNGTLLTGTSGLTFTDTVSPGLYYYAVLAYDAAGNFSQSSNTSPATILPPDTTPPSAPSGVIATAIQSLRVQISWTASTDDTGIAGYYIYRNGAAIGSTSGLSYIDTVTPGGYHYTVAAYDAAGNVSNQSLSSLIVMVTSDTIPPSVPTGLAATAVTTSSVTISWNASTDNVGVVGYYLYRNGSQIIVSTSSALTTTSYTDPGLSPSNTYTYTVVAYDAAGNISGQSSAASATTISDTYPPSTPFIISATAKSSNEIDIAWNPSFDNVGVAGYYVYRNGNQIANVSSGRTYYADTGLPGGNNYYYSAAAYDAVGNTSPQSNQLGATTLPPDNIPPSVPVNFAAKALSPSQIQLSWMPASDNIGVAGYHLYRSAGQILSATSTFSSSAKFSDTTSTSYLDIGLAPDTIYVYAIETYDTSGNASPQSTAVGMTPPNPPAPVAAAPSTPTILPSTTTPSVAATQQTTGNGTFTVSLYYGLRGDEVKKLQSFLVQYGYLGTDSVTGFFGKLTQGAVQKFQCDQNIVCSGDPQSTGWGLVGTKTRSALNSFYAAPASAQAPIQSDSTSSAEQLQAQIQSLQALLQSLQAQLNNLNAK